jgi:hypothetical protein
MAELAVPEVQPPRGLTRQGCLGTRAQLDRLEMLGITEQQVRSAKSRSQLILNVTFANSGHGWPRVAASGGRRTLVANERRSPWGQCALDRPARLWFIAGAALLTLDRHASSIRANDRGVYCRKGSRHEAGADSQTKSLARCTLLGRLRGLLRRRAVG